MNLFMNIINSNSFHSLTIFVQSTILDIRQTSEYIFAYGVNN